ncbi:MAG TPA: hypothetical protein VEC99_13785, partial [Clostridia bacterium]|nr:hypothetical protein [Clostridia bacterium]
MNTFKEILGSLKLWIERIDNALPVFFAQTFKTTRGSLQLDIAIFLVAHRDYDIRSNPFLMNYLMAGSV